jgi:hypothetical protein
MAVLSVLNLKFVEITNTAQQCRRSTKVAKSWADKEETAARFGHLARISDAV